MSLNPAFVPVPNPRAIGSSTINKFDIVSVGNPNIDPLTDTTYLINTAGTYNAVLSGATSATVKKISTTNGAAEVKVNTATGTFFVDNSNDGGNLIYDTYTKQWISDSFVAQPESQRTDKFGQASIDPSVFQFQGLSVAISGDGSRMAAYRAIASITVVDIYRRDSSYWVLEQTIAPLNSMGTGIAFGIGLGFDEAGLTLGAGATGDGSDGAVWIFVRDPGSNTWTQQAKLVGSSSTGAQGNKVAFSSDGNTVAFGQGNSVAIVGRGWIFVRDPSTNTWTEEATLQGTGAVGNARQGSGIALSADGNTFALGGFADNGGIGSVWVFVRDPITHVWTQQQKISPVGGTNFGIDVALSADGNTLAFGGPGALADGTDSFVITFTRTAGVWSLQTQFTASDYKDPNYSIERFGGNVRLDASGTLLLVYVQTENDGVILQGSVRAFRFDGTAWTQTAVLRPVDASSVPAPGTSSSGIALDSFGPVTFTGSRIDVSDFGGILVAGGPYDTVGQLRSGALFMFI